MGERVRVIDHIGVGVRDFEESIDFYTRALAPLGFEQVAFIDTDNRAAAFGVRGRDDGAPGVRAEYSDTYYAAYVLDPNGNNIEAVFHGDAPTHKGREIAR